jgi:hypothetical protein
MDLDRKEFPGIMNSQLFKTGSLLSVFNEENGSDMKREGQCLRIVKVIQFSGNCKPLVDLPISYYLCYTYALPCEKRRLILE